MQTRRAEKIQHLFCILGQQEEEHGIGGNSGSTAPLLYSSHAHMQGEKIYSNKKVRSALFAVRVVNDSATTALWCTTTISWSSARGRMYTLASLGLRRSAAGFCVASVGLGALPRGRMYALASLVYALAPLWRGRRGTWCTAKGSDARPGVPWSPPLCRWLLRGRLGALQGVGCTPWRPLDSGGFWVAGAALGPLQGVGCTPWRPLVPLVALAWQVRHLVLCKGSDVRPGIPWSPPVVALPVAFAWQVRHPGPINTSRWLQSRQHPILTEVPQKFLKQCLFL